MVTGKEDAKEAVVPSGSVLGAGNVKGLSLAIAAKVGLRAASVAGLGCQKHLKRACWIRPFGTHHPVLIVAKQTH